MHKVFTLQDNHYSYRCCFVFCHDAGLGGPCYQPPPGNGVGIAIGSGSTTDTYAKKQIAIGVNSKTISDGSAPNDSAIAIGAGAHTYNELGRRVAAVSFGKQHADYTGGIAIGANTYAITTGTSIGQRDYVGAMGDITVSNSNRDILQYAPGATSLGSNAYAGGTLSTVLGAYNIATSGYNGTGGVTLFPMRHKILGPLLSVH